MKPHSAVLLYQTEGHGICALHYGHKWSSDACHKQPIKD